MPFPWALAIPAALSLGSSIFGGSQKPKQFGVSAADINRLIEKYREAGIEGLRELGIQERQNATARLAASGLEPTLGMQQALYNPILQQLGGARAKLEGNLAGTEGNLMLQRAYGQQNADMASYGNSTDLFAGLGDLSGLFALEGYQNWMGQGSNMQGAQDPFKDLFGQYSMY